jgi:hypothetical protein
MFVRLWLTPDALNVQQRHLGAVNANNTHYVPKEVTQTTIDAVEVVSWFCLRYFAFIHTVYSKKTL